MQPTIQSARGIGYCISRRTFDDLRMPAAPPHESIRMRPRKGSVKMDAPAMPAPRRSAAFPLTVRAVALHPWLRRFGDDPLLAARLEAHGLDRARLRDPYEVIPLITLLDLQEEVAALAGDPVLGARLGQQTTPADLGPAGLLMQQSGCIWRGLNRYAASVAALQSATLMQFEAHEGVLSFSYQLHGLDMARWPQDGELTLSSACRMIRHCFDRRWRPLEVHFAHRPSPRPDLLQQMFRAPVLFAQGVNRLLFSADGVNTVHREEDRSLIAVIERHVADLSMSRSESFSTVELVRDVVARLTGHAECSLGTVAGELGLTPRALQRRLAEEGSSLRQLQREERLRIVERQLADPRRNLAQIAQALGYSDGTVLWRAYRNWTGRAPSRDRARKLRDPGTPHRGRP
ncbi:AraC family transcriptional regulator [Propylenella binzhouense]|uniref:AraC family transcriptional regulator n=1 Tax=Propylenella binzhouense TaxID=2555902 RepID=A0A964T1G8_9HYPH|nr:AraC family transcriptional regulator [Propylenella binzhouense]MYZ46244.1 AraC family transcriptional regulator [Propylenella binzhouense]